MAGLREHEPRERFAAEQGLREGRPSPTGDWYGPTGPAPSMQDRDHPEMVPAEEQRLRRPSLGPLPRRHNTAHESTPTYLEPNIDHRPQVTNGRPCIIT